VSLTIVSSHNIPVKYFKEKFTLNY
jgi:hypothetical protein